MRENAGHKLCNNSYETPFFRIDLTDILKPWVVFRTKPSTVLAEAPYSDAHKICMTIGNRLYLGEHKSLSRRVIIN